MNKGQSFWRFLLEVSALAILALVLVLSFRNLLPSSESISQTNGVYTSPQALVSSEQISEETLNSNSYPPPMTPPSPRVPDFIQTLMKRKPLIENRKFIALDKGRMWIGKDTHQLEEIAGLEDVAAIYGWNHDGTKLLFGRGLYDRGELAKSTELWIYDLKGQKTYQLVDSTKILSASWSPVADLVAFSEDGDPPTISVVSLDGKVQEKRDEYLFSNLAWSPDGSAIAVSYSGPDMVDFDTRYSVLGIWLLEKDELQLISNAKREDHTSQIWLTDGRHILFTRIFGPGSVGGSSGMYIVDTETMEITPLQNGPKYIINRMMRSPRSDDLVLWLGNEIYFMELGKEPILIGKGSHPVWHPNGKTILYVDENGIFQIKDFDIQVKDQAIGGNFTASTIHLQPTMFFTEGNNK